MSRFPMQRQCVKVKQAGITPSRAMPVNQNKASIALSQPASSRAPPIPRPSPIHNRIPWTNTITSGPLPRISIPVPTAAPTYPFRSIPFKPLGNLHPSKPRHAPHCCTHHTQQTIHQSMPFEMTSYAAPPTWQTRRWIPPHRQTERERISNDDARCVRQRGGGVCGSGVNHPEMTGGRRLGVEQDVEGG